MLEVWIELVCEIVVGRLWVVIEFQECLTIADGRVARCRSKTFVPRF